MGDVSDVPASGPGSPVDESAVTDAGASASAFAADAAGGVVGRALGALTGLALGDALGMPTQLMSRTEILNDYGPITALLPAGEHQEVARGMPAGSITDDTEQALLLARLLIEGGGNVEPAAFARELILWERSMEAKGSLDLLGPSTKRAVERIGAGLPLAEAGKFGATNGAAMRITPIGIAVPVHPLPLFLDSVVAASMATHNTSIGLAAAAAVGAAVSAGVHGHTLVEAMTIAADAADAAVERAPWVAGGQIGPRIRWAIDHLRRRADDQWASEVDAVIGTDVAAQESVVAAFAIAAVVPDAWDALCMAASVGGDTDTIAAIVGAIRGASEGAAAFPAHAVSRVAQVNDLDLPVLAEQLLALRGRT